MNTEQWRHVCALRKEGYAVSIFTPDALQGVDAKKVEYQMILAGWNEIGQNLSEGDDE